MSKRNRSLIYNQIFQYGESLSEGFAQMRLSLPFLTDSILLLVQTDYANLILYIFA